MADTTWAFALAAPLSVAVGLPAWAERAQLLARWQQVRAAIAPRLAPVVARLASLLAAFLPAPRPVAPPTVLYAGHHRSPQRAQHPRVARLRAALRSGAARFRARLDPHH